MRLLARPDHDATRLRRRSDCVEDWLSGRRLELLSIVVDEIRMLGTSASHSVFYGERADTRALPRGAATVGGRAAPYPGATRLPLAVWWLYPVALAA